MEQAAKLTMDTSEALRKIRSHWLSRVIHDFRGPLFAARGYAKLIADRRAGDVTDTQYEYLQHILANINKLADLVNTLSEFPSDDALHLDFVDLSEILQSSISEWRARDETLKLAADLPPDKLLTIADREKLRRAVHKLLGAAVEFSRCGGEVQLQARLEEDELILRIAGIRDENGDAPPVPPTADIALPCEILRLHGGVAHIDQAHRGRCHVTVRLPLVNLEFHQAGALR